jgi:hypothetical protein
MLSRRQYVLIAGWQHIKNRIKAMFQYERSCQDVGRQAVSISGSQDDGCQDDGCQDIGRHFIGHRNMYNLYINI